LNGFPGGLTQIFWDTIQADKFAQLFGQQSETGVIAKTVIGYCDGKKIYQFSGEIEGNVPAAPQGDRAFQWDCVFIPKGHTETFAQMGGDKKNAISMRRKALDTFLKHLSA